MNDTAKARADRPQLEARVAAAAADEPKRRRRP